MTKITDYISTDLLHRLLHHTNYIGVNSQRTGIDIVTPYFERVKLQ